MISRKKYNKGDIVLLHFPFTDLSSSKIRPGLVFYTHKDTVVVAYITTKDSEKDAGITLKPSPENGLKETSFIVPWRIASLDIKMILGSIGELEPDYMNQFKKMCLKIFS